MTTIPNTKDFAAWINLMPGAATELIITGKVETTAGNLVPMLDRVVPQGTSPAILMLKLTIRKVGDVGSGDVAYRDLRYSEAARRGQFTEVQVFWDGALILTLVVTEAQ